MPPTIGWAPILLHCGMKNPTPTPSHTSRSPTVCLALAGGNALGAYTAGAVEALENAGVRFDVISGASIGALTAAIVAGNPPGQAARALREFWALGSTGIAGSGWPWAGIQAWQPMQMVASLQLGMQQAFEPNVQREMREMTSAAHALHALLFGRPGLFRPLHAGLLTAWPGWGRPMSLFDARPVVQTLERLIDFERLHTHGPQLIVCAVDMETGEPAYFDSRRERITPLHLLASTAFMPGFPPVEIEGRLFGDPGLSCNLPLDPVLHFGTGDRLCYAVDLFSGAGARPASFDAAVVRAQDVLFSAQSARALQAFRREQRLRHQLQQARHGATAPGATATATGAGTTGHTAAADEAPGQVELVLSTYRPPAHEIGAKTLDFSAASLAERWAAGQRDMASAMAAHAAGQTDVDDLGFKLYRERATEAQDTPQAKDAKPSEDAPDTADTTTAALTALTALTADPAPGQRHSARPSPAAARSR